MDDITLESKKSLEIVVQIVEKKTKENGNEITALLKRSKKTQHNCIRKSNCKSD